VPCRPFVTEAGLSGFVCGPARKGPKVFCVVCLRDGVKIDAPFLCDYPAKDGKTCDAGLCPKHTNRVRIGVDWCPEHGEMKP
jgi:hypothetical protein